MNTKKIQLALLALALPVVGLAAINFDNKLSQQLTVPAGAATTPTNSGLFVGANPLVVTNWSNTGTDTNYISLVGFPIPYPNGVGSCGSNNPNGLYYWSSSISFPNFNGGNSVPGYLNPSNGLGVVKQRILVFAGGHQVYTNEWLILWTNACTGQNIVSDYIGANDSPLGLHWHQFGGTFSSTAVAFGSNAPVAQVIDYGSFIGDGAGLTNAVSTNVFYSSKLGCYGDSDLVAGGGHDDHAKLQAAINQATNSPVEIVIERPTLVSTGLFLRSNIRIRGLPGAGLFLAANANVPILWNGAGPAAPAKNIVIENLTLNGNGWNQSRPHSGPIGIQAATGGVLLNSVSNAVLRDVTLRNAALFHFVLQNCGDVLFSSCVASNGLSGGSHDGWHFYGHEHSVTMLNCSALNEDDDNIAFNFDENFGDVDDSSVYGMDYFYCDNFWGGGPRSVCSLNSQNINGYVGSFIAKHMVGAKAIGNQALAFPFTITNLFIDGWQTPGLLDLQDIAVSSATIRGLQGLAAVYLDDCTTNVTVSDCAITGYPQGSERMVVVNANQNYGGGNPVVSIVNCSATLSYSSGIFLDNEGTSKVNVANCFNGFTNWLTGGAVAGVTGSGCLTTTNINAPIGFTAVYQAHVYMNTNATRSGWVLLK